MRRRSRSTELQTGPASTGESLSMVDAALRVASRREFFTRDEALGLLHRLETEARTHEQAVGVERIVARVDTASSDQVMIPRSDLLDPLLDIRLVLCT